MEEILDAFIAETRAMTEAHKEQQIQWNKKRQGAYDSLASIDFVCSNWSREDDISALQKIRENISHSLEQLMEERHSIGLIEGEISTRRKKIKALMIRLLELYRELCVEDDEEKKGLSTLPFEQGLAETLFHSQPHAYYDGKPGDN